MFLRQRRREEYTHENGKSTSKNLNAMRGAQCALAYTASHSLVRTAKSLRADVFLRQRRREEYTHENEQVKT